MRPIDADALRDSVLKWLPPDPCGQEDKEYPFETDICVSMLQEIEEAPTVECLPSADVDLESYSDKLWKAAYEWGRREAVVDVADNVVDRVFRDLNISCAYSMPGFWCHDRTDYAVIPTRYHKGYQKALEDAEKKIREALGEIAQGDKE